MTRSRPDRSLAPWRRRTARRGGLLLTAMLIAAVIAFALVGYLAVSRTALKLSHRTFFANDAANLAEAGVEEALYCFNLMAAGTAPATAWAGWTLAGSAASRTFPPLNRDQNGLGVMKVFVEGYDGSMTTPYIISQATLTPFDRGAPIVKVLQCALKGQTPTAAMGVVALNGFTLRGNAFADSFNSNPTNSPTGPWRPYSTAIARASTGVFVGAGTVDLGAGTIHGDLFLGPGVAAPPAGRVTGTIHTDQSWSFAMPAPPTSGAVSRSYDLGAVIPATLPVSGHLPAADGSYYYFCTGATIGATTITAARNVVLVGTSTSMAAGLMVQPTATCTIYMDGPLNCTGSINTTSWAGALRIYTTTTAACTMGNNSHLVACFYAPNASFTPGGSGGSGTLAGFFLARTINTGGRADPHYDEAIALAGGTPGWQVTQWLELHSSTDRATLGALTRNFLP